jgi:hypothetical protein
MITEDRPAIAHRIFRDHGGVGVRVVRYLLLVVLGSAVGVAGAFAHHLRFQLAGITVPYGLVLSLVTGTALAIAAGLLTHSRLGATAVAGPWLLIALPFATQRPEGDLIIPGTATGYAYLIGTALLGAMAVTLPYRDLSPRSDDDAG